MDLSISSTNCCLVARHWKSITDNFRNVKKLMGKTVLLSKKKTPQFPFSKRLLTPTEIRCCGFGTQWAVRGSNPRPAD